MAKFYMVCGPDPMEDGVNIVIANSAKEAKTIGANCDATDDVDFIDIRVRAIKEGMTFNLYDYNLNEITVEVGGKGYVYTEHTPQFCGLDDKFIDELKGQERYWEVDINA